MRSRSRASASAALSPHRSSAGAIQTELPSIMSTEGSAQQPRTTIASCPVSLPAIAKWLEASASVNRPVSGRLGDHRELGARGQRGADQRREHEDQRRLGGKRIDAGRAALVHQPRAQPRAADERSEHRFVDGLDAALAGGEVDDQRATEIATRWPLSSLDPKRPVSCARHAVWHLTAGVGDHEPDRIAGGQGQLAIAGDLVAVERGDDVLVREPARSRRRAAPGSRRPRAGSAERH